MPCSTKNGLGADLSCRWPTVEIDDGHFSAGDAVDDNEDEVDEDSENEFFDCSSTGNKQVFVLCHVATAVRLTVLSAASSPTTAQPTTGPTSETRTRRIGTSRLVHANIEHCIEQFARRPNAKGTDMDINGGDCPSDAEGEYVSFTACRISVLTISVKHDCPWSSYLRQSQPIG